MVKKEHFILSDLKYILQFNCKLVH